MLTTRSAAPSGTGSRMAPSVSRTRARSAQGARAALASVTIRGLTSRPTYVAPPGRRSRSSRAANLPVPQPNSTTASSAAEVALLRERVERAALAERPRVLPTADPVVEASRLLGGDVVRH